MKLLLQLLLISLCAWGQFGNAWRLVRVGPSATRPPQCAMNRDVFVCSGSGCSPDPTLEFCVAQNTWAAFAGGGGGSGTVTDVAATGGVETTSGSSITTTGTLRAVALVNAQTGTSYTILTGDRSKLVTHTNASSIAVTLPQAGGTFPAGWFYYTQNRGAGTLTITPTTSTIDGAANLILYTGQGALIYSDGTNYFTQRGKGLTGLSVGATNCLTVSGNASLTVDINTSCVPTLTLGNTWLGDQDFSTASSTAMFKVGTSDPATCNATLRQWFYRTDTNMLKVCNATNTWTPIAQTGGANAQTGTTYTVLSGDRGKTVTFSNASSIAVTLPQAGSTFEDGWWVLMKNIGAGDVTITPTTSTISGAASIVLSLGEFVLITSNGTNYEGITNRMVAGSGIALAKARTGVTPSADTAVVLSRATDQAGTDLYCRSTTGNDTYTCTLTPTLTAYTTGMCLVLSADTANTGAATVNVDAVGAKSILTYAGAALSNGDIPQNIPKPICYDGTQFIVVGDGIARTMRINMLAGGQVMPDTSGNVFMEPYTIKATNDFWGYNVWIFNDTSTDLFLYGVMESPDRFVSGAKACVIWTSTATSGNVEWGVPYRMVTGDDTTSLDQATAQTTPTPVVDAAPTAANRRLRTCITLTDADFSTAGTFQFKFSRNGASGSDTMAAAAMVHGLEFEYIGR